MAEIQLSQGKVALVDDSDFELLSQWNWCLSNGYAVRRGRKSDGTLCRRNIQMHRQILGITDSKVEVDHINHTKLDNRKGNIRVCTGSENHSNSELRKDSSSGYKGVSFDKSKAKWLSQIKKDGVNYCLGHFRTKEQSALAYNQAALRYFGEFALLNEVKL